MSRCAWRTAVISVLLALAAGLGSPLHALEVTAQGLLKDAAVLVIDGRQQMLRSGERSVEGVLLVSADPRQAIIEYQGQRHALTLNRRISSVFERPPPASEVAIPRDANNQYRTVAEINGKTLPVLVDTGASSVVLSADQASQLGIDYLQGAAATATTAAGDSAAYRIKLHRVSVGGIVASHIPALVIEGSHPPVVLLGMTFLQHVEMRETGGTLYLKAAH